MNVRLILALEALACLLLACGERQGNADPGTLGQGTSATDAATASGPSDTSTVRSDAGVGASPDATGVGGPGGSGGAMGDAGAVVAAGGAGTDGSAGPASMSDDAGRVDDAATRGAPSADCEKLVTDPTINWRESALQTDQEIVECLATSLGRPVGYGEKARGGYDAAGGSKLTIIKKDAAVSVERQVADAVGGDEPNWIVFDKVDFKDPYEIGLYRLRCGDPSVQAALGIANEDHCIDYRAWCSDNGVSGDSCLATFFNERLNDGDLPIRNIEVGSNKTIDGRQSQARFLFSGFAIGSDSSGEPVDTASSVIVTNLWFQGAGHAEDHELDPDMIRSTGASHDIWIHQNTFDLTGDSAFDVKVGAHDITISFNLVRNVLRAALHGSSDSRTINAQIATTLHDNAFITTDAFYTTFGNTARRVPLIRRGKAHLFNNVFYNYRKDILSVRVGARVLFEDNMFLANPEVSGDDDLDYYAEHLLAGFEEGGLTITESRVWWSDASCHLDPTASRDLSASYGSTPDMFQDYGSSSQSVIEANRFAAGKELADYVLATAGKGGAAPFNSPYAQDVAATMNMPHRACQQ